MSDANIKKAQNRRKSKSKSKKTKPKLTKEFKENDKQIEAIMKNTEFVTDKVEEDSERLGNAFFCDTLDFPDSVQPETTSSAVESELSQTPRTQTTSSFIQVEEEDPIVRLPSMKVSFSNDKTFVPSSNVIPYIQTIQHGKEAPKVDANLIRLINRCYEEGSDHQIASATALMNQTNFFKDEYIYATVCESDFNPTFSVIKPGNPSPNIPNRKLLALKIKKLKFIKHPLQQQEHILMNKLKDHLDIYFKRQETKVISKLNSELDHIRSSVNSLLEHGDVDNFVEFEKDLSKLQKLRTTLHQEETAEKDLLRNILDTWVKIKKLRKEQQFHWTSLELKIKLNEVDLDEDNAAQSKRFETELNEIYREELEAYYKEKRLRKSSSESKLTRPKKPNIEKIKRNLKDTLDKCSRHPGEPEIEIVRSSLADPSRPLESIKTFFLKLFFDDQLVGSSKICRLEPDLSLAINESFGIYLDRRIPKEIKVKLYEKKTLPLKIANILIPLPSTSGQSADVISFSSHKKENITGQLIISFEYKEEVGSQKLLETQLPSVDLAKISQNMHKALQSPAPPKKSTDQDANNQRCKQAEKDNYENTRTCTFQETLLEFCSADEIENNPRFNMLNSNYRRHVKTKNIKLVPCVDNEIEQECEERVIEIGNWINPIDVHKHNGKKHLQNIYEVVKNHCEKLSQVTGNTAESLYESGVVTLKSFLLNLSEKDQDRPLKPKKKPQPVVRTHENVGKFNIVVNLIRATGIPVRSLTTLESEASIFNSQTFKYSNVKPYVSVVYQERATRTITADGSSPTWNEQLTIQITEKATDLKGDLKIAIFDECIENQMGDNVGMEIYQRYQANWLAEYRLPISTILAQQRIEGILELTSPRVLLGYNPPTINEVAAADSGPEIKTRVNLWLIISIEPSFEMPKVDTKDLECAELNEVRHHMQQWCLQAKMMRPSRFIDPLVCTMDGKRVCMSRLLEPVPLPIENSNSQHQLETACRYVSLLNVFRTYEPCMYFPGIWLNNQTLLDTGWGSQKDLGVLLANFLLTVGIRCWVVLGTSYLHGESAFVLYEEGNEFVIINPSTGKKYSTRDPFCPMKKAFYVFSQHNVYLNIQKDDRIYMMSFNTRDSSSWFPLFTKKNPAPLGGVQKLAYVYKVSNNTNELRKSIEYKIMKKINSWRPMQKTIWNRAFQKTMLEILVDLENELTTNAASPEVDFSKRIHTEFGNYKLFGFTLNFSYTNLSSISDRIKSTGIHLNGDKSVEFGVAVHIHAYPYNVLSVWIFLVTATPK